MRNWIGGHKFWSFWIAVIVAGMILSAFGIVSVAVERYIGLFMVVCWLLRWQGAKAQTRKAKHELEKEEETNR